MQISIPADKAKHFVGGSVVYQVGAGLAQACGHPELRAPAGTAAAGAVGLIKERWDWWKNRQARKRGESPPHRVEFADAFATLMGGVACLPGDL
jgi:hypothetical protein